MVGSEQKLLCAERDNISCHCSYPILSGMKMNDEYYQSTLVKPDRNVAPFLTEVQLVTRTNFLLRV